MELIEKSNLNQKTKEFILQYINFTRSENTPVYISDLENHIIIKYKYETVFTKKLQDRYCIYIKKDKEYGFRYFEDIFFSSLDKCLLAIALDLTTDDDKIINFLLKTKQKKEVLQ